jgi:hypothetical protein
LEHIANFSPSEETNISSGSEAIDKFFKVESNLYSRSIDCALEILIQVAVIDL